MKTIVLIFYVLIILPILILNRVLALKQDSLKGTFTGEKDRIYMFTAPTCKIFSTMKNTYAQEIANGSIAIVDITRNKAMARQCSIRLVPAIMLIIHEKIIELLHGFVPRTNLNKWLNN